MITLYNFEIKFFDISKMTSQNTWQQLIRNAYTNYNNVGASILEILLFKSFSRYQLFLTKLSVEPFLKDIFWLPKALKFRKSDDYVWLHLKTITDRFFCLCHLHLNIIICINIIDIHYQGEAVCSSDLFYWKKRF